MGSLRITIGHNLVEIRSYGNFEIAELFKQIRAIQKCNKIMFFLISGQRIIMKQCVRLNSQVASRVFHGTNLLALGGI